MAYELMYNRCIYRTFDGVEWFDRYHVRVSSSMGAQLSALLSPEVLLQVEEAQRVRTRQAHRERLAAMGLDFKGIRKKFNQRERAARCHECARSLDSSHNLDCAACAWMICKCGACGCGYDRRCE